MTDIKKCFKSEYSYLELCFVNVHFVYIYMLQRIIFVFINKIKKKKNETRLH